ncbi:fatty acid-binding protein DegV [Aeromicrobium sp. PE09-221]|uniref:DegV family protein n=1 Tax=Aeromicrobium sp. PE09-221 TaxID=1898043 RepID=UPI000B3E80C2|nr:DegV family protein [Aeromicrobium sp. PE09-221]OUZ07275.1 fatty acid-binding protein DegV [Aeromicrobium sp. PE09-221]
MSIAIVTDSTASLDPGDAQRERIVVVPTTVVIGSRVYTEGVDIDAETIAGALRDRATVSTSRPSPEAFAAVYAGLVAEGATEIVSVHLSKRVSGTIDSARLAASRCEVPVHIIDTGQVGIATGFAAGAAARIRDEGGSSAEIVAAARRAGQQSTVLLYVDTLEYLKRGGRIGAAQALIGSALAVKPILTVADGAVVPLEKVRTSSKALARVVELAIEAAERFPRGFDTGVQHLAAEERAAGVAARLADAWGRDDVPVDEVGADIGAHVGPGMIAVTVTGR